MENTDTGIKKAEKPFFAQLSQKDFNLISSYAKEKAYLPGDIIVREKTLTDSFCIIKNGTVEISKKFMDEDQMVLAVMSDGDFFGEMALLDQGSRSATVKALAKSVILEISRGSFELLLNSNPNLAYAIMIELSKRLRDAGSLLVNHLEKKNRQLSNAYINTVQVLVNALEARDKYTHGHTNRVTAIALAIAKKLGIVPEDLYALEIGALLHDVGKIGVPDAVLGKPGPLEKGEFSLISAHPATGGTILGNIEYLERSLSSVLYHHERYDGSGYPSGIKGKTIPVFGRIIAVADSFDAMISDRPYRKRMSVEYAVSELKNNIDKQFDGDIVNAFIEIMDAGGFDTLLKD